MREQIEVVYENGILRPLGVLSEQFQEHQHLTVTVEDAHESRWLADADPTVSLEAVRRASVRRLAQSRSLYMLSVTNAEPEEARMADRFFDTSAFAKHYRTELGTAKIDAFLAETGSRHFISDLGVVELHSVLARLVRNGQITTADFHLGRGRFLADIASGLWQVVPFTAAHFHHAQQLLVRHGLSQSLRTLDALQLAVSLLSTVSPFDAFVCADSNLCLVAAAEGLVVVNPEVP